MNSVRLITALGTPLEGERDDLCVAGLEAQFDDQADAGVEGVLVAGTMGAMQMLTESTWASLVRASARLNRGRFELLVGVTDQSLARVLDRVRFVETVGGIDGVVALTPSAMALSEDERVDFYMAVADAAGLPVFIYELAPSTGVTLSLDALIRLSQHPNLAGVKISCNLIKARALVERVEPGFRVIPAEPQLLDLCASTGPWAEHLDGVFAATPHWGKAVLAHASAGHTDAASAAQRQINRLLQAWISTGQIMAAFTATMNHRGLPGRYFPRPLRDLDDATRASLLESDIVRELVTQSTVSPSNVRFGAALSQ